MHLIHRLVVGDDAAVAAIIEVSRTSDDPQILVAAALFAPDGDGLLARAETRRGDHPRPPARGDRGRPPARRARARRRPRARSPRRPPGQHPRRLDRGREPSQGGVMNPKLTAALLILAAVLANLGLHRPRLDLQLPRRAQGAGGRRAGVLPRARRRRQRLVRGPRPVRRADGADRDRRRAAVGGARHAHRGAGGDRGGDRAGGRPGALADPRARLCGRRQRRRVPDGERHPRHRDRRDGSATS